MKRTEQETFDLCLKHWEVLAKTGLHSKHVAILWIRENEDPDFPWPGKYKCFFCDTYKNLPGPGPNFTDCSCCPWPKSEYRTSVHCSDFKSPYTDWANYTKTYSYEIASEEAKELAGKVLDFIKEIGREHGWYSG